MIYPEYKMLKAIRKLSSGQNAWITVCYKDFTLTSQTLQFNGSDLIPFEGLLDSLCDKGFIEYVDDKKFIVKLTSKGLHFRKHLVDVIIGNLFRSVLLPIGVSIITTLITLWLTRLL